MKCKVPHESWLNLPHNYTKSPSHWMLWWDKMPPARWRLAKILHQEGSRPLYCHTHFWLIFKTEMIKTASELRFSVIPQWPAQLNVIRWEHPEVGRGQPVATCRLPPHTCPPPVRGEHRLSALSWQSFCSRHEAGRGNRTLLLCLQASMVVSCKVQWPLSACILACRVRHLQLMGMLEGLSANVSKGYLTTGRITTSIYLVLKIKLVEERLGPCKPVFKTAEKQTNPTCCRGRASQRICPEWLTGLAEWP